MEIIPNRIIYSQELDILNSALQRRLEVFEQEKVREEVTTSKNLIDPIFSATKLYLILKW